MRRILLAVSLLLLVAAPVLPQAVDSTSITWGVTGRLLNVPGLAEETRFSCSVTNGIPNCALPTNKIALDFIAASSTSFKALFKSAKPCGSVENCTALFNATDTASDTVTGVTCSSGFFTVTHAAKAYLPCSQCFGGIVPSFTVDWQAKVACTTTTTTSTTTTT